MRVALVLAAALLALGVAPRLIEPPFLRKWTQVVGDGAPVVAVRDGLVYYSCEWFVVDLERG